MMLEWSCPWVNGLDVHVALDRNLVPHHKLTAAIKNEVISCRNEQCHLEKKKKKVSHSPLYFTTKCKLSLLFKETFD